MEEWKLVLPSEDYMDELGAYRQEFLSLGNSMDGCGPLRRFKDMREYLRETELYLSPETVPEGRVQATQFLCVNEGGRLLGMIQVRHYFNDYLSKYAGHVGYSVRPSERKKGVAKWMLKTVLPFCREIGLDKVLVCCLAENEASRRTIFSCGGEYESTVYEPDDCEYLERYWIKT